MCFMPYPTKLKGGWQKPCQVVVNKSTVQIREKKATRKFANKYPDIFQNNMAEGPKDPQGPFFYQEGGKTYASLPMEMLQNIQKSPLFEIMQKDCQAEGIEIPKTLMAKEPVTHLLTPQEYLRNVKVGTMPLYISKNTLTTYTIAIVQNTQALQYDQMHVALQMARNQASLETPLRAEELMTAHFNLAVLLNETDISKMPDAQKPEATTLDADPSTSTVDEQTYVKIPSWHYAANCDTKKQHPTGTVAPTCRRDN